MTINIFLKFHEDQTTTVEVRDQTSLWTPPVCYPPASLTAYKNENNYNLNIPCSWSHLHLSNTAYLQRKTFQAHETAFPPDPHRLRHLELHDHLIPLGTTEAWILLCKQQQVFQGLCYIFLSLSLLCVEVFWKSLAFLVSELWPHQSGAMYLKL